MNWNFTIRLLIVLGILGCLITQYAPTVLTMAGGQRQLFIILIIFIILVIGIVKFLKAGLKKNK